MDYQTMLAESDAICAALSNEDDTLKRDVLGHAGNRWALSVVHILGVRGSLRHAELARLMPGVTQRMLTRTLRQLERDGLLARHDFQTKHPHVEYKLTSLGEELLSHLFPVWRWVLANAETVRAARARFDAETTDYSVEKVEGA